MGRLPLALLVGLLGTLAATAVASADTSHKLWPRINGMLLMNKNDSSRPLDARPGRDPFGGQDRNYLCDTLHKRGQCRHRLHTLRDGRKIVTRRPGHNKLLGGHGSDTIYAGPWGDVIWGDYKPSGQPLDQHDRLYGGAGRDFIYASHGWNTIKAGRGDDFVKTHYGRGTVDCGTGRDTLYTSRRNLRAKRYRIRRCERVTTGHSPATQHRLKYGTP